MPVTDENLAVGTQLLVLIVADTDLSLNMQITYSIDDSNAATYFQVVAFNTTTAVLSIR